MMRIFILAVFTTVLSASAFGQDKTFVVKNGEAPWYDRADRYVLADVPERLVGKEPIPQQSCGTRQLEVSGSPKFITMGVSAADVPAFKEAYPTAKATGEKFAISPLPAGGPISYEVFEFPDPPVVLKGASSGFQAGLIMLAVSAESTASAAVAPAPAQAEAPKAAVPPPFAPALVPFETGNDKKKLSLYLLMGQSNMLGRDIRTLTEQTTDPRIGFLRGNKWFVAIEPMAQGGTGIGPGISFARTMLANDPEGRIGLIACAVGGSPLMHWEKGAPHYENAVKMAKIAMASGTLKGMLWHQGESDSDTPEKAQSYETRLAKMFEEFRRDVGDPDLPIVVGQLGEFVTMKEAGTVNAALKKVAKEVPHVAFVESKELTDRGDRLHFDAKSEGIFGERYAKAMLELLQSGK